MSARRKVVDLIIDADTAGDDVASLLVACLHPNVRLLAVTVCMGNVDFDQQIRNTLYTLEQCDAEQRVRVYAGSRQPLEGTIQLATEVHGIDGMGDSNFPPPVRATIATDEDAVSALIRLTGQRPGQLTILAQAPLTNVAKAVMREPNFARNTGRLFIMGGTYFCRGNVTPAAEYNFFADPKAASIVLQAGFAQCYLIDWGVCVRDGLWDRPFLDRLANSDAKLAKFILSVIRRNVEFCKTTQRIDGTVASDSLAMAVIADESICRGWIPCFMQVETTGQLTRGATVVDSLDERINVHVCRGVDSVAYKTMICDILTCHSNSS